MCPLILTPFVNTQPRPSSTSPVDNVLGNINDETTTFFNSPNIEFVSTNTSTNQTIKEVFTVYNSTQTESVVTTRDYLEDTYLISGLF